MSASGRVAAVVVTHNRKGLLLECVECLKRQTAPADILVVDNASTDGTGEALKPLVEAGEIACVNTGANLGGAGGFNLGIRRAVEAGYDYVWIMDDDSMPTPTALQALLEAAEEVGDFGWLSGKALWSDGSICKMNVQRDLKMGNITDFSQKIIPSGAATFVSLLLPAQIVRGVGLPIREFFIWADDLEYTRRISRKYPCWVAPASVTVHRCATNNGGNIATDRPERIDRYRYAYRNEVYVYRREGWPGIRRLLLRTPLHIARVLVKSKSKRLKRIWVILSATIKGIGFNPRIEYIDNGQKPSPHGEGGSPKG